MQIASEDPPPRRLIAGADVIALAHRKIEQLRSDIESHRTLSESRRSGNTEIVVTATPAENTVRFYLGRGYRTMVI